MLEGVALVKAPVGSCRGSLDSAFANMNKCVVSCS